MVEIFQAQSTGDLEKANQLNWEYLKWCVEEARNRIGEELDLDELYGHSLSDQEAFMADNGRLLLAREGGVIGGIACLKKLKDDTCEIKRMYVQPEFRGKKIGELLLSRLIEEAKTIGYAIILLDSDPYMTKAHSIYRALGFVETEPYPGAEMSDDEYSRHMIYMELVLK